MKKSIIVILAVVLVVLTVGICLGVRTQNNIQVGISTPTAEDGYISMIMFGGIPDNLSKDKKEKINEINKDLNDFYESFFAEYEKPYFVEAKYEIVDGKTIITFKGEVTNSQTKELEEFNKSFSYDYVVTKKVNNDISNYKYF